MATELAQAYVQIIPSAKGISGSIQNQLDPEASAAGHSAGNKIGAGLKVALVAATAAIGVAVGKVISDSISEGAKLQQSLGGVETLFKDSAGMVKKYANEAYKTVGLSANDYMENVTGFSASLLQSMGGDTKKAAKVANMAMVDMGDNANKMGTNMGDIQNAYQGFAKQNYTMLDNLKLGYGGTKTEMERLLADATKLTGVKYDMDNLGDVYSAIHEIQEELDITGTTAKEANETFAGSFAAMGAAYKNVLGKLSIGENIDADLKALAQTVSTFLFGNFLPMVGNVLKALPGAIKTFIAEAGPLFLKAGQDFISNLGKGLSLGKLGGNALWISHAIQFVTSKMQVLVTEIKARFGDIKSTFDKLMADMQPIINNVLGLIIGWAVTASTFLSVAIPAAIDFVLLAFEGLSSVILPVFDVIINAVRTFSELVTDAIMNYVVPALQNFTTWMSENQDVVNQFGKVLGALVIGFGAFKAISSVVGIITTVGAAIKGLFTAFTMIKSVAGVLALVKAGFATLVTAVGGPIILIIAAIAALVAGFVYLWNTNEGFKNAIIEIWNSVLAFLQPIMTAITGFIMELWGTLTEWWSANQQTILQTVQMVWSAIQIAFQIALGVIQVAVTTVLTAIQIFWSTWGSAIMALVKVAWEFIKMTFMSTLQSILTIVSAAMTQVQTVIATVMGVIQGIIKVITGLIKGDWSMVWEGIKQVTSAILNGIKDTISNVLETAKNLVSDKIEAIKGFFKSIGDVDLYQIGKDIIQGLINGVGSMIGAIGRKVSEITSGIKEKITSAFDIHSPSKWMENFIGNNMMIGWETGIDKNADKPEGALMSAGRAMMTSIQDSLKNKITPDFGNPIGFIKNELENYKAQQMDNSQLGKILSDTNGYQGPTGQQYNSDNLLEIIIEILYQLLEKDPDIILDGDSIVEKTKERYSKALAKMNKNAVRNNGLQPKPI